MNKDGLVKALKGMTATADDQTAVNAMELYPKWKTGIAVSAGDRLRHKGILYKCIQPHTTQETWISPDSPSLWAKVLIPDPDIIPCWEQPDSTNAYAAGDKVTHKSKTWESLVDGNVWEPGAAGTENLWKEVTE